MQYNYRIFQLFGFLAIFLLAGYTYSQNSIQGTVRYSDDNTVVTSGTANAYDLSGVFAGTSPIYSDGTYSIGGLTGTEYDIIGIPGIGQEDFPPTGYPSATDPMLMTSITASGTVINKDIYVERILPPPAAASSFISGNITVNNKAIADANVYAMQNGRVIGFATTNSRGDYRINSIPLGDYVLVIHRIGNQSAKLNISLDTKGIENLNFNLKLAIKNNVNTINPAAFKLNQNYPNPFNPSTLISYTISKDAHVSITVYNELGETVATIVNADEKAGAYTVKFDGAGLSSGIYFYKLVTAGFVDTKRMVLIK
jgi:hypothetical protein